MKDPKDRLCSLMCDDVEIEISILFDEKKDKVEGYVDNGTERKPLFADHATVWLAKGINPKNKKKPWKQALVFSFCKGSSSVPEIKNMYTEVVRRLHGIGFTVVASVCDQGATNEKAMKELLKESKNKALKDNKNYCENTIVIDDKEIVHLFDYPHLLKCLRNNLITEDLLFTWKGKKGKASWTHLERAFTIDKYGGMFRLFRKLSEANIHPNNKKKCEYNCVKVFLAIQLHPY